LILSRICLSESIDHYFLCRPLGRTIKIFLLFLNLG
jgi:hypothetical protein